MQRLAVGALLGTDRRGPVGLGDLPGRLGEAAGRLEGDPAAMLLDAAALAVTYRRGGFRAPLPGDGVRPAPAESLPVAGRTATARLGRLLSGADLELVAFWCRCAAGAGRVAPPVHLPALLDLAARQPVLGPVVTGVLGERGRWLARQRPSWAALAGPASSPKGGGDEAAGAADVRDWELGSPAQQVAWFRRTRRQAPQVAREALAGDWERRSGADRATLLALLAEGLGPADEALLETALDDRSADVRAVAADLLARLPSSAFADRMRARAKRFVRPQRVRLRVRLVAGVPGELDEQAVRDGILDTRPGARPSGRARQEWWLEQVVAATPLTAWQQLFESPEQAVAAGLEQPWRRAVHAGWAWAAIRQRDPGWALALLATGSRYRVEELLGLLEGEELTAVLSRRIRELGPAGVEVVVAHLEVCPVPWPREVATAVLEQIRGYAGLLHPRQAPQLLNLTAYRFPPGEMGDLVALAGDLPLEDPWRTALRSVARVVSVRARIQEELQ